MLLRKTPKKDNARIHIPAKTRQWDETLRIAFLRRILIQLRTTSDYSWWRIPTVVIHFLGFKPTKFRDIYIYIYAEHSYVRTDTFVFFSGFFARSDDAVVYFLRSLASCSVAVKGQRNKQNTVCMYGIRFRRPRGRRA